VIALQILTNSPHKHIDAPAAHVSKFSHTNNIHRSNLGTQHGTKIDDCTTDKRVPAYIPEFVPVLGQISSTFTISLRPPPQRTVVLPPLC
jgi:hypothetical protein